MSLDPQAAAELSQEITLVTRALFAQLLPATAANAVGGIGQGDRRAEAPGSHTVEMTESAPVPVSEPPVASPSSPPAPVAVSVPPASTLPPADEATARRDDRPPHVVTPQVTAPADSAPAAPAALPVPAATAPAAPIAVPVPSALPVVSVDAPAAPPAHVREPGAVGGLPVPSLPVPGLPVPGLDASDGTDVRPMPAEALRPSRRGTAVLDEIAFLDE